MEYAIHKGRPVKNHGPFHATLRDKEGRPVGQGELLGVDVELPFGHRMFAKPEDLEPIKRPDYDRLVKEEREERERLSRKDGFATEVIYSGSGWTNAATERGR